MNGFLVIDKPVDWTSHDVVAKVRRILGIKKIGHAGTLDPFATGVLPLAIGNSTRLIRFLPKSKKYLAEVDLSRRTDTDDLTGETMKINEEAISKEIFREKINKQIGEFEQIPPLYSAKKIKGKKLYELAREGASIDLSEVKAKKIKINDIKILSFNYPKAEIEVSCSEGTYIRSIARDCGGHLSKLKRLESNGFAIHAAIDLESLLAGNIAPENFILKPESALKIPSLDFDRNSCVKLQQGQDLKIDNSYLEEKGLHSRALEKNDYYIQCFNEESELIGLATILKDRGGFPKIQPKIIL